VRLFQWRTGKIAFFSGQTAPHVEFPLDLEVVPLVIAGVEASETIDATLVKWRARFEDLLGPAQPQSPKMRAAPWPPLYRRLIEAVDRPAPLGELLSAMAQTGATTANDVLRALEVLLAAKLVAWQ